LVISIWGGLAHQSPPWRQDWAHPTLVVLTPPTSPHNSCNDCLVFAGMTPTLHKSQVYCSGVMQ